MGILDRTERALAGTKWNDYLTGFRLDMNSRNLSQKTIEGYSDCVCHWVLWLRSKGVSELAKVDRGVIQAYILSQKGSVADATINTRLRHVRGFLRYLWREEVVSNQSENPARWIRMLKVERGPKPVVTPDKIGAVLRGLARREYLKWNAYRDLCMVLVFWDCMVRLSELRGLRVQDVSFDQRTVTVLGKGRKRRIVPVGEKTLKALHKWVVRFRGDSVSGDWLFTDRAGNQLKARNIHRMMSRLGKRHRIKFNPHLIRHSSATWWMSQPGANLEILRRILGHSSILVTQQYLHFSTQDSVDAYARNCPSRGLEF